MGVRQLFILHKDFKILILSSMPNSIQGKICWTNRSSQRLVIFYLCWVVKRAQVLLFWSTWGIENKNYNIQENSDDLKNKLNRSRPCKLQQVHQCICSLLSTILCVMSRELCIQNTPKIITKEIKLFLSGIHRIDFSLESHHDIDDHHKEA